MTININCYGPNSTISVSSTHVHGSGVHISNVTRTVWDGHISGHVVKGRIPMDLDGVKFDSREAVDAAHRERGYVSDYTRNCVTLKMSPRMRREDCWTQDSTYLSRFIRHRVDIGYCWFDSVFCEVWYADNKYHFLPQGADEEHAWSAYRHELCTNGKAFSWR